MKGYRKLLGLALAIGGIITAALIAPDNAALPTAIGLAYGAFAAANAAGSRAAKNDEQQTE